MRYAEKIEKLEGHLRKLKQHFNDFPQKEKKVKHFDQWTIREVLIHLNGWNELRAEEIENLLDGEDIPYIEDLDDYNQIIIEDSEGIEWDELLKDFDEIGSELVRGFSSIPEDMTNVHIFEDEEYTPAIWLQIDIDHHKTHIEEIEDVLRNSD